MPNKPEDIWSPILQNGQEVHAIKTTPLVNFILEGSKNDNDVINKLVETLKQWDSKEDELVKSLSDKYESPYSESDQLKEILLVKDLLLK